MQSLFSGRHLITAGQTRLFYSHIYILSMLLIRSADTVVVSGRRTGNGSLKCTMENGQEREALDLHRKSLLMKSTHDNMYVFVILYTFYFPLN